MNLFGRRSLSDFFTRLSDPRKESRVLLIILLIGALLRIYISYFTGLPHIHRDSLDYLGQADAILSGGYINYFPNGYPFLIAGIKLIFPGRADSILLFLSVGMSIANVFLTYKVSREVFGQIAPAFLAAFIIAIFPSQINYTRWLTTEVPTAFLLLLGFHLYFKNKLFWSGLILGLATAFRTDEAPVFILLIIIVWLWRRSFSWNCLLAFLLPLIFVGTYCYFKTGQFSIAGHGQINIMYSITSSGSNIDWYYQDKHPEVNSSGKALKMFWDYAVEDPVRFLKNRMANLWELWGFFPSSDHGSRSIPARLVIGAGNFFMVVFGLYAWWVNRKNLKAFLLIIPFVVVTPIHTILLALPRYTYPVEPFMLILASWALWSLIAGKEKARVGSRIIG